ncbi:MAG: hypothetical protein M1823_003295 [Watsoniomyces obsoletus]|nr:MAG: hypothetical protein M1823_003295 [Watsoniomyces obsoletus]
MSLFRRLRTQSKVFTWGSADRQASPLGHTDPMNNRHVGWPTQMAGLKNLDPVVDVQCGGWSTTVMTSKGDLYSVGRLDGELWLGGREPPPNQFLERLNFPPSPNVADTTVTQFSSGRTSIVALSESGVLWQWRYNIKYWAARVEFEHLDTSAAEDNNTTLTEPRQTHGQITRAVAGWHVNSAYVVGKGIVYWKISHLKPPLSGPELTPPPSCTVDDTLVPGTSYRRPRRQGRDASAEDEELGQTVGEMRNYIVLEHFIVFLTDLGKIFAFHHTPDNPMAHGIFELKHLAPTEGGEPMSEIQGSFRSFAVFNSTGDVVIGSQEFLQQSFLRAFDAGGEASVEFPPGSPAASPPPVRPPALQNRGVISLAFGDWHQLALTRDGRVLASGNEPQACGCLGLGTDPDETTLRGVVPPGVVRSAKDQTLGRWPQVWFSTEQREWLRYLAHGALDSELLFDQLRSIGMLERVLPVLGDWVEVRGGDWDLHPDLDDDDNEQASGRSEPACFALKVAAAGWHSGALVLCNREKMERMYRIHKGFLPASNTFNLDVNAGPSPFTANRILDQVRTWWAGGGDASDTWTTRTTPVKTTSADAQRDQADRRRHSHYYTTKPWNSDGTNVPPAARHEVRINVSSIMDEQSNASSTTVS